MFFSDHLWDTDMILVYISPKCLDLRDAFHSSANLMVSWLSKFPIDKFLPKVLQ